ERSGAFSDVTHADSLSPGTRVQGPSSTRPAARRGATASARHSWRARSTTHGGAVVAAGGGGGGAGSGGVPRGSRARARVSARATLTGTERPWFSPNRSRPSPHQP